MPSLIVLSDEDIEAIDLATSEILQTVEIGLVAEAQSRARTEPTVSFRPTEARDGLVSVIRGSSPEENLALVKTVGTFPTNAAAGLPANPGLLLLLNAETGAPLGLLSAARLTTMRTAAVTAIGVKYGAREDSQILGCIGARGIALQAAHYIAELFPLSGIRVHSPNLESRSRAAEHLRRATGVEAVACADWESCLSGADIMVEGASLSAHEVQFPVGALKPGVTLIAYGIYSSMPADIVERFDRIVMDRWLEGDTGVTGALGPSVASGQLKRANVHAMLGDVVAGAAVARSETDDCVLVWHRGVAACDIALASLLLKRAGTTGIGQTITI